MLNFSKKGEHINVYITNLQKYNEGYLIGAWVTLPITNEELEKVCKSIGMFVEDEGGFNEEFFITDFEYLPSAIYSEYASQMYPSFTSLNAIAYGLEKINYFDDSSNKAMLDACLEEGNNIFSSIENVARQNLRLDSSINDYEDLGKCYDDSFLSEDYFNFFGYGKDFEEYFNEDMEDEVKGDSTSAFEFMGVEEGNYYKLGEVDFYNCYSFTNYECYPPKDLLDKFYDYESLGETIYSDGEGVFTDEGFVFLYDYETFDEEEIYKDYLEEIKNEESLNELI